MSKPCIFRFNGQGRSIFQFVHLLALAAIVSFFSVAATAQTTFTNDTTIILNDSPGPFPTNPGLSAPYPSAITVTGMTGNITDVNLRFNGMNHTFPGDLNFLLVGPGGQKLIFQGFCGYDGDLSFVTYSIDDQAASPLPCSDPSQILAQPYRPTTFLFAGYPQTIPFFPAPAPADCNSPRQASCTLAATRGAGTMATQFNGVSPNGTWQLYGTDFGPIDEGDISGGWSLIITTDGPTIASDAPVDLNGDMRTDYAVVRETGASTQSTWFYNLNNSANPTVAFAWGVGEDFSVSEDFDNDNKDDITAWRPSNGTFYIFNSLTSTVRVEQFGQNGDNPTVVDDYNNDGSADLAVFRGSQGTWFYRTTPNGPVFYVPWGAPGDFVAPGDYNGDGNADFGIQRGAGANANFWIRLSTGATSVTTFGYPTDWVVPGDYDGDAKIDIAVARPIAGGAWHWFWIRSLDGQVRGPVAFGVSATDFLAHGDYNGDGMVEPAVWRNNGQFISLNPNGTANFFSLGASGDFPVANFNAH